MKISKMWSIILFIVFLASLAAESSVDRRTYTGVYTLQLGPQYTSGDLVTTLHSTTSLTFDSLSSSIERIESLPLKIGSRVLNTAFQGTVGSWVFITMPHELSHMLRAYEYGDTSVRPHFPDFMDGYYTIDASYGSLSSTERMNVAQAGMEFSHLQAERYIQQGYTTGMPSYGWGFIFGAKAIDGVNYMYRCIGFLDDPQGWLDQRRPDNPSRPSPLKYDLLAYNLSLAENYGYFDWIPETSHWPYEPEDPSLYVNDFTKDQFQRMESAYLQTLVDPALFTGLWGLWKYLSQGEPVYQLPMFRVQSFSFMPSIEAYMGHKGVENHYRIYYRHRDIFGSFYLRYGGNLEEDIWGGGISVVPFLLKGNLYLGGRLDGWTDGGFSIELEPRINLGLNQTFGLKAGYKTSGSLPGYSWQQGFNLSLSFSQSMEWLY